VRAPAIANASTDVDCNIHAGMEGIAKEILTVQVVNVNVVSIEPPHRPRVNRGEPKTTVLKTSRPADEIGPVYVKHVLTAKTGTEAVVWNAPMTSRGLRSVGLLLPLSALRLLSRSSLLLLLSALRLLSRSSLLLLLSALWLLSRTSLLLLLSALRLLSRPSLLLLSALRLLCRSSLLLLLSVLRLLCRSSLLLVLLWLLLLFVSFLRVGRYDDSGKQKQNCCR